MPPRTLFLLISVLTADSALGQGNSISHTGVLQVDSSRARQSGVAQTDTTSLLAIVLLTYADTDNEFAFLPDATTKTYGLEYKNVTVHPTQATALTLDLKYNHVDAAAGTADVLGINGEYHFTLASSLLAGVQVTNGNGKGLQ